MAAAQVAAAEMDWEAAEAHAEAATTAVEGLPLAQEWEKAVPLSIIASVYARTGRVVFAEGILRQCAKCMRLSADPADAAPTCDTSLAAVVAWQMAQLFSALPKRESEARAWEEAASRLWPFEEDIKAHLGTLNALTGKGERGRVFVISLLLGRVALGRQARR